MGIGSRVIALIEPYLDVGSGFFFFFFGGGSVFIRLLSATQDFAHTVNNIYTLFYTIVQAYI